MTELDLTGSGASVTRKGGAQLKFTRDFRAPRERVWRAWIDPQGMLRWWGPPDCPAIEVSADVRVGGAWRACLRSPDGRGLLWQSGRYLVMIAPQRLEFTFAWEGSNHEDGPGVQTHVTVLLEELPSGGTRMHFAQTGLVSENSVTGHTHGWSATFDRLNTWLEAEE